MSDYGNMVAEMLEDLSTQVRDGKADYEGDFNLALYVGLIEGYRCSGGHDLAGKIIGRTSEESKPATELVPSAVEGERAE